MRTFKIVVFWSFLFSLFFSAHAAMIGQNAYIVTSMNYPHVATDEDGFDAYMKVIASGDVQYGVTELYRKGKLFQVENNAKVTILDKKFLGRVKVRILDGKMKGSSGWVAAEWIKDQIPSQNRGTNIPDGLPTIIKGNYRVIEHSTAKIMNTMWRVYDVKGWKKDNEGGVRMYPPIYKYYYDTDSSKGKWEKSVLTKPVETDLTMDMITIIDAKKQK